MCTGFFWPSMSNRLTPANQATLSEARVLLVPSQWASTPPPANTLVSPRRTSTCCACRPTESMIILRSEEHTSELQSLTNLVCRLLLEKKNIEITKRLTYHYGEVAFSSNDL